MKKCFVISPIGSEQSIVRQRSDQLLEYVIKPAASAYGYEVVRADHISTPGLITPIVIEHLLKDPLVIADLTFKNPNVFYELAIRHAARKPVINIKDPAETIPFDVAGMRTIDVDYRFITSMNSCRIEIENQVRNIERHPGQIVTPITLTQALLSADSNETSQNELNIQIMSTLQSPKAEFNEIRHDFGIQQESQRMLTGELPLDIDLNPKKLQELARIFSQINTSEAAKTRKGKRRSQRA